MNNEPNTPEITIEVEPETVPDAKEVTSDLSAAYPELEKLKAANEVLREKGKEWLLTTVETICNEINQASAPQPATPIAPDQPVVESTLQIGNQDWQFEVGDNVMVGERLGIRHKNQTLLVEVGWPRLPEHGIVPDLGLARARISFSQNIMIDAKLLEEFSLRRGKENDEAIWYVIVDRKVSQPLTPDSLRTHIQRVLSE